MNSNIFFQPFVGKDYANGGIFDKRIMILGESHYCDESCTDCGDCQLHRECMGFYAVGAWWLSQWEQGTAGLDADFPEVWAFVGRWGDKWNRRMPEWGGIKESSDWEYTVCPIWEIPVIYIPSVRNLRRCRCVMPSSSFLVSRGVMEITYFG